MSARILHLSTADVGRLLAGFTVGVFDSAGRVVLVSMQDRPGDHGLRLTLSETDLKTAAEREGLHCGDPTGQTGWRVHVLNIATPGPSRG